MRPAVLTGEHFMTGDVACAEGALAAGCRFFGGYPITPATEIAEHISGRLPEVGGTFIQMEDEIAAMASIVGASCAGVKSMTATSGPGLSLMLENIGLAALHRNPMRGGECSKGGTFDGTSHLGSSRGHDAGPLGISRPLRNHRAWRLHRLRNSSIRP